MSARTTMTTITTTVHGHDHDVTQHDPEAAERNKVPFYGQADLCDSRPADRKRRPHRAKTSRRRSTTWRRARRPNGARLVARAWVDPAFKQRLLTDPKAACAEMGVDASSLTEFVVLENTEQVHNLVVCTLCSCYPRPILGRPPDWYKSFAYRSRAVVEPRAIMREFGTELRRRRRGARVRQLGRHALLVLPRRPERHRGLSRSRAGRPGHPRQHDRRHGGEEPDVTNSGRAAMTTPLGSR